MTQITLITGGARSGKSDYGEAMALNLSSKPVYIATCEIMDDEMRQRVAAHQEKRGEGWQEIYAPLDLAQAIENSDHGDVRLVDCLTLWANNLLYYEHDWRLEARRLCAVIAKQKSPIIFVTNEVGMGIAPDNKLARDFRDVAGKINQMVAAQSDEIYLMVCGHPMKVKP